MGSHSYHVSWFDIPRSIQYLVLLLFYGTLLPKSSSTAPAIIYTYFEEIDVSERTTGMENGEDKALLSFWKARWEAAGWKPIILTPDDVMARNQKHLNCTAILNRIKELHLDDFGKILLKRWMAMAAAGGGWFSDYDNFPLGEINGTLTRNHHPFFLPNNGQMTVHDILSPTLASGNAHEWLIGLESLLKNAEEHCSMATRRKKCIWTDTLAIHSLRVSHGKDIVKTTKMVTSPFDEDDPVYLNITKLCRSKHFRNKWTIHFGQEMLQSAKHVPPTMRLPKYRMELAMEWLKRWEELCGTYKTNYHLSRNMGI
mmetsp:Transcript_10577/g.19390  ORF Transcript_10577/g.19390 Transcript_10577/m.19390 type:complete len:313 (+) Transcript_10577:166-1104(+)